MALASELRCRNGDVQTLNSIDKYSTAVIEHRNDVDTIMAKRFRWKVSRASNEMAENDSRAAAAAVCEWIIE